MSLPVLTAVTNASWEAELVAALDGSEHGVTIVRRCVDVADLLAAAAAGTARAAVLSADLRRLDQDVLTRLAAAGVAVVGLVESEDEDGQQRLNRIGIRHVLPASASAEAIAGVLARAATQQQRRDASANTLAGVHAALPPISPTMNGGVATPEPSGSRGQLVAVWGPAGSPGRSTVAMQLADEASRLGASALLVDADSYGGVVGQLLGFLDEAPGLAAAAHAANNGQLSPAGLVGLARTVHPGLRVLTGITRAERWTELRGGAIQTVLQCARSVVDFTVVDCGFSLENDEELSYDTMAPRRNAATLVTLEEADVIVAVGAADPIGLGRLIRGLDELANIVSTPPRVVINKVRHGVIPGDPAREITATVDRFLGLSQVELLPYDQISLDRALARGQTLAQVAANSPLRTRLAQLAEAIIGARAFALSQRR